MSQALAAAIPRAEQRLVPNTMQLVYDKDKSLRGFHALITEWLQAH
jgi:hypothetical protein